MSTKSTIYSLPCCHIYYDCIDSSFCIDVDYGYVEEDSASIQVCRDSEFSNLMRYLLKGKTQEELEAAARGEL